MQSNHILIIYKISPHQKLYLTTDPQNLMISQTELTVFQKLFDFRILKNRKLVKTFTVNPSTKT